MTVKQWQGPVQDFDEVRPPYKDITVIQAPGQTQQGQEVIVVNKYGDNVEDYSVDHSIETQEKVKALNQWWNEYVHNYVPGGEAQQKLIAQVESQPLPPNYKQADTQEILSIGLGTFFSFLFALLVVHSLLMKNKGYANCHKEEMERKERKRIYRQKQIWGDDYDDR